MAPLHTDFGKIAWTAILHVRTEKKTGTYRDSSKSPKISVTLCKLV